jgi:hypothetical protein
MSEYVNPSCPMYRKPSWSAYRQSIEPGAFLWTMSEPKGYPPYRVLWIRVPTGDEICIAIGPLAPGIQKADSKGVMRPSVWTYDEATPLGRPTLTPSILHARPGWPGYWHGYVTQGVLVGCRENLP